MKKILRKFFKTNAVQKFLAFLGTCYVKFVFYTSKWDFINRSVMEQSILQKNGLIVCFWHGKLLMMPFAWQFPKDFFMLISDHSDGRFISKLVANFNIKTVLGSTKKGGVSAFKNLVKILKSGNVIGITPDGPKGPAKVLSDGVMALSEISKVDILPLTFACKKNKSLKTWDRFSLALPFNEGIFYVGNPISFENPLDIRKKMLRDEMERIESIADNWFKNKL
jgi:lysophospholipid acyltransferase (LPLAT)-like uncharacterized protein